MQASLSTSASKQWAALVTDINSACDEMKSVGVTFVRPSDIAMSGALLGKGANGTVRRGTLHAPGTPARDVAIKMIHATGIDDIKSDLVEFQNEMLMNHRASGRIREGKPSRIAETICCAVEVVCDTASVRFLIVMEHVSSGKRNSQDVADLIQDDRHWKALRYNGVDTGAKLSSGFIETETDPIQDVFAYVMSRKRKLTLAVEIARSLRELALSDIVHLDWKPSNILAVARSGTHDAERACPLVKLIDFGDATTVAREHEPTKTLDYTTGTPGYSAPESEYGIALLATDVFSVGVTILELWVGCLWHGATSERGYHEERMRALQKVERSDPMVASVLAECLRPDPATRPTATQLLHRLKKIQKAR